jgi:cytochrome c oxidase subunit III
MATTSPIIQEKPSQTKSYLGMIFFLISEVFLFGSLFWTYYYLKIKTPVWPPQGVKLDTVLASVNTVILVLGSGMVWWAVHSIRQGKEKRLALGLAITMLLGAAFLGITFWEWVHLNFRPWSHAYGSTVYIMTGFHAVHVLIGTLLMLFLLIRTLRHRFSARHFEAVEVSALYWHFVDVVWLAVFSTIFIIK